MPRRLAIVAGHDRCSNDYVKPRPRGWSGSCLYDPVIEPVGVPAAIPNRLAHAAEKLPKAAWAEAASVVDPKRRRMAVETQAKHEFYDEVVGMFEARGRRSTRSATRSPGTRPSYQSFVRDRRTESQPLRPTIPDEGMAVSKRFAIQDVELVCSVLSRLDADGRGAAAAVASELGIARSVVSDCLARVERHFGRTFVSVERGRTGRLTADGRAFLENGRPLLDAYVRLREGFPDSRRRSEPTA